METVVQTRKATGRSRTPAKQVFAQAHLCSVEATLSLIDGKWKGITLFQLGEDRLRFGELHRRMPNVTQRVLTKQLREMERDGLVSRHVYAEVPPRVEYQLTPLGDSLRIALLPIKQWGLTHLPPWADDAAPSG